MSIQMDIGTASLQNQKILRQDEDTTSGENLFSFSLKIVALLYWVSTENSTKWFLIRSGKCFEEWGLCYQSDYFRPSHKLI